MICIDFLRIIIFAILFFSVSCDKDESSNNQILVEESTPIFDFDGNEYKTIKIGNQIWMAENLKTTHYSDGTQVISFFYNNDSVNVSDYGRLYSWYTVMNNEPNSNDNPGNIQGIAPNGWHIPSQAEWKQLIDYLGGASIAGGLLKETGESHWQSPNVDATNESLFNALPAGMYAFWLEYQWLGQYCVFATTTDDSSPGHPAVIAIKLNYDNANVIFGDFHPDDAVSVRCIKD